MSKAPPMSGSAKTGLALITLVIVIALAGNCDPPSSIDPNQTPPTEPTGYFTPGK